MAHLLFDIMDRIIDVFRDVFPFPDEVGSYESAHRTDNDDNTIVSVGEVGCDWPTGV